MERLSSVTHLPPLGERERLVLAAVIQRHVATAEPVSSQQLCGPGHLTWSSATIRNCMARLEELGLLSHPYTSAGKVPTVRAYRYFVEQVMESPSLAPDDLRDLHAQLLRQVRETDQVLKLSAKILAMVTSLLAVIWIPEGGRERLTRIRLVRREPRLLLLAVQTASGREIHRLFDPGEAVSPQTAGRIAEWINERGRGRTAEDLERLAAGRPPVPDRALAGLLQKALLLISTQLAADDPNDWIMEGTANLVRQPEFNDVGAMRQLVDVLDRREELWRLLDAPVIERQGVCVAIGEDRRDVALPALSFVSDGVPIGAGRWARLGIIGPRRMAYERIIPLVHVTAAALANAVATDG